MVIGYLRKDQVIFYHDEMTRGSIHTSAEEYLEKYFTSLKYCESSGRDAGGGYLFRIERSKMDHNGSIIVRLCDYAGQVILHFRIMISPAENPTTAAYIMKDPPPCLTFGRIQSYAGAGDLQAYIHPIAEKSVKDDLSDRITFFHISINHLV
ncbi:hypothetical protein TNCV_4702931 [Trichonephila clavipes]|nr:hypothetical protein TNCV_4702931 [Trichonephila clavipes]